MHHFQYKSFTLAQLWKFEDEVLKSKSGTIWKPEEQWTFVTAEKDGCTGYIANSQNPDIGLGLSGDSVIEVTSYQNDTTQIWKKGEPDRKGYYTLTSVTTQKVLTAISDETIEVRGKSMIKLFYHFSSIKISYFFISHQTMNFMLQKFWWMRMKPQNLLLQKTCGSTRLMLSI